MYNVTVDEGVIFLFAFPGRQQSPSISQENLVNVLCRCPLFSFEHQRAQSQGGSISLFTHLNFLITCGLLYLGLPITWHGLCKSPILYIKYIGFHDLFSQAAVNKMVEHILNLGDLLIRSVWCSVS